MGFTGLCLIFVLYDFAGRARLQDVQTMHELDRQRSETDRNAIRGRFIFTSMARSLRMLTRFPPGTAHLAPQLSQRIPRSAYSLR